MDYSDISQYNFYDIESFIDWLLIECQLPDGRWFTLENPTFEELATFMAFRNLVGFNNHSYDDTVLAILYYHHVSLQTKPHEPVDVAYAKQISDSIINEEKLDIPYYKTRLINRTFDVQKYTKSDLGYATIGSLKTYENASLMDIEETPVPFDQSIEDTALELIDCAGLIMAGYNVTSRLDKRLINHAVELSKIHTNHDDLLKAMISYIKDLVKKYCRHDVEATKDFMKLLIERSTVQSVEWVRDMITEELGVEPETMWYKSANSLVIKYFEPELGQDDSVKYNRDNFFKFLDSWDNEYLQAEPMKTIKETLIRSADFKETGYQPLVEEFAEKFGMERKGRTKRWEHPTLDLQIAMDKDTFVITYEGFDFGLGGIHSHQGERVAKKVHDADVDSLHPSTMMAILALGSATEKFKKIVTRRLEAKRSGDTSTANALKIVINSIYGLCRSLNSGAYLYGRTIGLDVCIAGELLLYWLAKEIESVGGHLIQTNTDGVMYTAETEEIAMKCELKILEVSLKTGYNFSSEVFEEYYAKDVNNYFTVVENKKYGKKPNQEKYIVGTTKGALFNKKPFGNNQIVGQFIIDYIRGRAKSLGEYLETNPEWLLCRAKVNRQFELIRGYEVLLPTYSEKTGKQLKGTISMCYDTESIGQQVRGYPIKDPKEKVLRKLTHKTGKFGSVARVANQLSDTVPPKEKLDYQYFIDQILDNLAKIRPVTEAEKVKIISIITGEQ